jgi:AcrR family transcriptional regulator
MVAADVAGRNSTNIAGDSSGMRKSLATKVRRTQAERREEAEQRILNAAIRLIVEKGYDRFTLADVGDRAGYSRALPAHYFGKKDDLLSKVAQYLVSNYRGSAAAMDGVEPGLPRLTARIRHYVKQIGSPGSRALGSLFAEARAHPKIQRTVVDLNRGARVRWEAELQRGVKAGNIRPNIDSGAYASVIHAFLRGQFTFVDLDPGYNATKTTEAFIGMLSEQIGVESRSALPRRQVAKSSRA